jgi:hydrogenase expression/formation protein HypC
VTALHENDIATVSLEGVKKRISLALVEDVSVGDYVLVHVGYALHKVSPEEADRTLKLMADAGLLAGELEELAS